MRTPYISLFAVTVIPFLAGCASQPVTLSTVGPEPAGGLATASKSSKGYLQVFSATEKSIPSASDDPTTFNLHTGYDIHEESGRSVNYVQNHASNMDEWPDQVALPAGTYNIVAESSCCGQVTVPVVIQAGKTTVVHLDRNWSPPSKTSTDRLVFLPDGEAVGWNGTIAKTTE